MADRFRPGLATVTAVAVAFLLVIALFLTPTSTDARGQLTSYSAGPGGARALHDLVERQGWEVERRRLPFGDSLPTGVNYAVLDPPLLVTAGEVHVLLEAVRAGAGLLVVVPAAGTGALADSLGLTHSTRGGAVVPTDRAPGGFCPDSLNRPGLITWVGGEVVSYWLQGARKPEVVFTRVASESGRRRGAQPAARPAMAGYVLGRGRVVAIADPDLLRNDVLRVCRWNAGPTAMAALEWLAVAGGERLVFDEYHHDLALAPAPFRTIGAALFQEPWARAILVGGGAALILLAAAGLRPMPPVPQGRAERRSPLEHASALGRAWAQAGSTRVVARRLVRGLRRRHPSVVASGGDDGAFLAVLAARRPELARDIAMVEGAMAGGLPPDQLSRLGDAVARLDSSLHSRAHPAPGPNTHG